MKNILILFVLLFATKLSAQRISTNNHRFNGDDYKEFSMQMDFHFEPENRRVVVVAPEKPIRKHTIVRNTKTMFICEDGYIFVLDGKIIYESYKGTNTTHFWLFKGEQKKFSLFFVYMELFY